jgi:hypothetical protein
MKRKVVKRYKLEPIQPLRNATSKTTKKRLGKELMDKISKALGASRTIPISDRKHGTPIGWLEQAAAVNKLNVSDKIIKKNPKLESELKKSGGIIRK